MKPFIVCHMMASLDGRIDCDMLEKYPGGNCYYDVLDSYKCQAFIEGRVSRAKHAALPEKFEPSDKTPCGFSVFNADLKPGDTYAISIDTYGSLMWPDWKIDEKTLICIVSEDAPVEYLKYLRRLGAFYIAVGKGRIDLPQAMDILNTEFGIERVALVGGGNINGAFLDAGLIDEISMVYGPIIDARKGMAAAFDGLPAGTEPRLFTRKDIKSFDDGCVWITYTPAK